MPFREGHRRHRRPPAHGGALLTTRPGSLDLSFDRRGRRTVLTRRLYTWPFTVGRTFQDDAHDPVRTTVIVQSATGTVNAGDDLRQEIHAGSGAHVRVVGQGAVSVHRAHGGSGSSETTRLTADAGAWVENLAQPRVLFSGADFTQRLAIDAHPAGVVLSTEAFILHEVSDEGWHYSSHSTVIREGSVVAQERVRQAFPARSPEPAMPVAHALALLVGGSCDVDMVADGWRRWHEHVGAARCYGAVSALPHEAGLVVRLVADNGMLLRTALDEAVTLLRGSAPAWP